VLRSGKNKKVLSAGWRFEHMGDSAGNCIPLSSGCGGCDVRALALLT
jgi:hypothetical protein